MGISTGILASLRWTTLRNFRAHGGDDCRVVRLAEDRAAGDERVGAGRGDGADVVGLHAAIHLEQDFPPSALARHVYEKAHYQSVRALEPHRLSPAERAARFIYLNKTCFNGLWRVNRAGRFNVPIGRYTNPRFYDPGALLAASIALARTDLLHAPFEDAIAKAAPGDFVYLDPPYDPVSATSSFASYTADGFTWDDQKRLARACIALNRRGVRFLLSNSATDRVRELYRGFEQRLVRAPRFINSKAESRGRVDELLVFNA